MTSGSRSSVSAATMFYANGVPDMVLATDLSKGKVHWGTNSSTNGVLQGDYFGVGQLTKVDDPQCSMTNVNDRMGFNMFANNSCTLDALADSSGNIIFQHPLPGKRGNLGRNTVELPGTWRLDANMSKTFRLTESKSLQTPHGCHKRPEPPERQQSDAGHQQQHGLWNYHGQRQRCPTVPGSAASDVLARNKTILESPAVRGRAFSFGSVLFS
jgi:hypothetical protein